MGINPLTNLYLRRHSPGRVDPVLLRENHGDVSWVVSSPGVAAITGFAAQAKPARFGSAGASALHTFFGDAVTGRKG